MDQWNRHFVALGIMFLNLNLRKAYFVEPARRSCGAVVQVMKLNGATPATWDMAAVSDFFANYMAITSQGVLNGWFSEGFVNLIARYGKATIMQARSHAHAFV